MAGPLFCTKIASRLTRTYTDRHGLKDLLKDVLDVDISKQQQSSDWAAETLSEAQLAYAASDVLHLHALKERLDAMLARENRRDDLLTYAEWTKIGDQFGAVPACFDAPEGREMRWRLGEPGIQLKLIFIRPGLVFVARDEPLHCLRFDGFGVVLGSGAHGFSSGCST